MVVRRGADVARCSVTKPRAMTHACLMTALTESGAISLTARSATIKDDAFLPEAQD
jgi:hypothetical protein